jgi:hypothetical protein
MPMLKIQDSPRAFWIAFLTVSLPIGILALGQTMPQLVSQDIAPWRSKWTLLLLGMIFNIILGGPAIWGLWRGFFDNVLNRIESASSSRLTSVAALLVIPLFLALFWLIRLNIFGSILPQLFPSVWIFLWLTLLAALAFKFISKTSLTVSFVSLILLQGVVFRLWSISGVVTDFPFSIDYSETSRFYYASLPFSQTLYGMDLPLSTLHPSRYLLQAIPFLVPGIPLWGHRLWQAILWVVLTGVSSWLLARRMKLPSKHLTALFAAWGFIYFLQGVVYYHLQVCVIIVLLGYSSKRPYRTLTAVILASLWAGISRVNWFPVPAMLAIALHLLEEPVASYKNLWQYLKHPALWILAGLSSALLSQFLYIFWSGNVGNAGDFGSSFTSDLIWSRLLPNVTYPLGVLPGILIVSAPLLLFLAYLLVGKRSNMHGIRVLGLFSMLGVLFLGGLVVSTKIGGGADIHNMDAFMVLLAVISCSFFAGQVSIEGNGAAWRAVPIWVIVIAALIPTIFSMQGVNPRFSYDRTQAQADLDALRAVMEDVSEQGGEVLFISERQLLMFHMVEGVRLVPDYEVVTLMEMGMSGNQSYLDRFYEDLSNHRFELIVSRNQRPVRKTGEPFAEENNVWIEAVTKPLLCSYDRKQLLEFTNILLLVPVKTGGNCR